MGPGDYFGTTHGEGAPGFRPLETGIGWDEQAVAALIEGVEPFEDVERRIRPVPPPGSGERFGM